MQKLRLEARDAELLVSEAAAAAWSAAERYCECLGNVYNESIKIDDENSTELTSRTREDDWDSYLESMILATNIKNIAKEIKFTKGEY